jgi:ABC-2 type transport system ATP-binding protein
MIALESVSKRFGSRTVVHDVSFTVERGEIVGFLGPNGAGKTTTLKMMLGLLRPDRGTVRLFGRPPEDPAARAKLGFLPENPYFYDYLTAVELLDLYGRLHGLPSERRRASIEAVVDRVGLRGKENTALRKLSKGLTQRVGLAQAIQHDPELVILDEPMSGLDPVGRREVRDLILGLRTAGRTVLFSSHILQDAEMLCDRVAIVFRGRLRAVGRLEDLVGRDARWIEVSVRGPVPPEAPGQMTAAPDGTTLVRVPDMAALMQLLDAVRASHADVLSVWPRRESLEDLFLREVGRAAAEERAS